MGTKLIKLIREFMGEEHGLVTVEWVALAGAVIIGGIAVVWFVMNSLTAPAQNVGGNLTSCETIAAQNTGQTSSCP